MLTTNVTILEEEQDVHGQDSALLKAPPESFLILFVMEKDTGEVNGMQGHYENLVVLLIVCATFLLQTVGEDFTSCIGLEYYYSSL